jgi:hypothetical protein
MSTCLIDINKGEFNSEIIVSPGIWMSFFTTEEAHAVMPATVADEVPIFGTGSAGKSRLTVTAPFGAKKDTQIPRHYNVTQNTCPSLVYRVKAIIKKTFKKRFDI